MGWMKTLGQTIQQSPYTFIPTGELVQDLSFRSNQRGYGGTTRTNNKKANSGKRSLKVAPSSWHHALLATVGFLSLSKNCGRFWFAFGRLL